MYKIHGQGHSIMGLHGKPIKEQTYEDHDQIYNIIDFFSFLSV